MAAVAIVLLIACVNLAGLMMSRAAGRRREFGVRVALGAERARLLRQMLTDAALLAGAGAVPGFALSVWAGRWLLRLAGGREGIRTIDTTPDLKVLGFTAGVAVGAALLVGLLPTLRFASLDPQTALREARGERTTTRFARVLIPAQVALATVLVVAATLFLSTFENFRRVELGFPADQLLTFRTSPASTGYEEVRRGTFYRELLKRLEALPGVRAATLSSDSLANLGQTTFMLPLAGGPADMKENAVGHFHVGVRWAEAGGLQLAAREGFHGCG